MGKLRGSVQLEVPIKWGETEGLFEDSAFVLALRLMGVYAQGL